MTTVVDEKLKEFRGRQADIQKLFGQKQQSLSQHNENTLVKGELDLLSETDTIFKLVGPVLMKVDLEEAKHNVSKRMEFIESDMKRVDDIIAARQGEQAALGEQIQEMQRKMQADAAAAAREAAAEAQKDA
mmetsp:Transcript_95160/g.205434  ORF Transcript_95160/g.205434 Transcript_95160/m.205434 type:complete len:131 (-) Transcript_95160:34-426(-)